MSETKSFVDCSCGVHLDLESSELRRGARETIELACRRCGRRIEIQEDESGWTKKGELVPEGSVPVEGFSRELRLSPDVERYWFEARDDLRRGEALGGEAPAPDRRLDADGGAPSLGQGVRTAPEAEHGGARPPGAGRHALAPRRWAKGA